MLWCCTAVVHKYFLCTKAFSVLSYILWTAVQCMDNDEVLPWEQEAPSGEENMSFDQHATSLFALFVCRNVDVLIF